LVSQFVVSAELGTEVYDFHFISPIDNALDRETYLEVCWPNSAALTGFDDIHEGDDGDRAFIVYEARTSAGKTLPQLRDVHGARPQAGRDRSLFRLEVAASCSARCACG
jgi:hypothetical protein